MASRAKRQNVIVLPNKDKLPIGKIKDFDKFLSFVSAEYGISEDIGYFTVEKEKSANLVRLQFVPRTVTELHSTNAKKFVVYELTRIGYGCVLKIDDDLNKKAAVVVDLINKIDDACKETVTSKLNTMFDVPGELDYLLDKLLMDPQFNSIKYTVLNDAKTSCLLCINGYGLCVRSMDPPFDDYRQLAWQDIATIKTKGNKLIFRKTSGEIEEIMCINKKTVVRAQIHLLKYLNFVGNRDSGDSKRSKGGWLGSFAQRIRQSFSRRPRTRDNEADVSVQSPLSKSAHVHYSEHAPPNSTVPGSSVVSDDGMDNVCSLVEPSIKTNSTHDVSFGSENSYVPSAASLEPHQHSMARSSGQEDHISVKTTSTYEVSLDCGTSPRTLSNGSKGDYDSPGIGLSSFGPTQSKKSATLSQMQENIVFRESEESCEMDPPAPELPKAMNKAPDTKIVAVPQQQLPTRTCDMQQPFIPVSHYPRFDAVKVPPPPPIRSVEPETKPVTATEPISLSGPLLPISHLLPQTVDHSTVTMEPISVPRSPSSLDVPDSSTATCVTSALASPSTEYVLVSQPMSSVDDLCQETRVSTCHSAAHNDHASVPADQEVSREEVIESASTLIEKIPIEEIITEKEQPRPQKFECKLPVSQKKSIPSPKIQRPSRIPSVSSYKEQTTPTSSPKTTTKIPSPSDKENYNSSMHKASSPQQYPDFDDSHDSRTVNFSRFENEEYTLDSKTTITSVSTAGDNITKKSIKTEISSVKASGIPAPKQYKTTTTITSTVKKAVDAPKSPVIGVQKSSGIPRMASK